MTGSLERVVGSSSGDDPRLAEVRDVDFPIALRGYEREAVDAYVKRVTRVISELEADRSPDAAVRRALEQVGQETSGILQRAQETASDITARSRASADDRIRKAERDASALTADAEERVRELEADFGRIWSARERLLDEVRELAERLLGIADEATERFPSGGDHEAIASRPEDTASIPALAEEPAGVDLAFEAGTGPAGGAHGEAAAVGEAFEPPEPEPYRPPIAEPVGAAGEADFAAAPDDEADFADASVEQDPEADDGPPSPEPGPYEPRPRRL
ncbi:MAG: DivIVA domain-containing protein [Actinomycetota bacterium]|nr:DivIVA domain-containing protein [Actinomycetota bacterium]